MYRRLFSPENIVSVPFVNKFKDFSTSQSKFLPQIEVNGVGKINYEIAGEGDHNVLCIPGLIGSIELDFGKFLQKVNKAKFRWIAWDPPGYGKSRPPDRDFSDSCFLNDAVTAGNLMEKLGIQKYSVFGWSQGAGTAMFLAGERSNNVMNVVTVGAKACYDERMVRVFQVMSSVEDYPPEDLKERLKVYELKYLKKMLKDNLAAVKRSVNSPQRGDYLRDCFPKIQCPVLYVHGSADHKVPLNHAHQLARRTKNARVAVISGACHELHVTHTEEFMRHAEPFILEGK